MFSELLFQEADRIKCFRILLFRGDAKTRFVQSFKRERGESTAFWIREVEIDGE